uniref:Uncharacterized protein n=1 Tax=Propithecus coquereli TaxID=379532 RepID=A0A2K6F9Q5_PROCO
MPKKAGATNKGRSQSKEPERPLPPLGPVAIDPKGYVTIAIHAKPGSKQNAYNGTFWFIKFVLNLCGLEMGWMFLLNQG